MTFSNLATPSATSSSVLIGRVWSSWTWRRRVSRRIALPWSICLTNRLQPSMPLFQSARRNIVSAVPRKHILRNPQICAFTLRACSSGSLREQAAIIWSSVITSLSWASAHSRSSLRIGALYTMYRSTFVFQAEPLLTPSNLNSASVVSLSSNIGRSLYPTDPSDPERANGNALDGPELEVSVARVRGSPGGPFGPGEAPPT